MMHTFNPHIVKIREVESGGSLVNQGQPALYIGFWDSRGSMETLSQKKKNRFTLFLIMCIYVCLWVCTYECRCLWRPVEGVGTLGLELWIIVSCLT